MGGTLPQPIDIRLVSATNVSPSELKNSAVFRPDLLYRLNTVEIHVPPLRDRLEDISLLVEAFLGQYTRKYNRAVHGIDKKALALMNNYPWPGNVRELRYSIERAVILSDGDVLTAQDFASLDTGTSVASMTDGQNLTLEEIEQATIRQVLEKHKGNISKAAKELGLTRTSLYRRIGKYEL